ncbi:MAG: tRNA (adenosine(37)-N6)-dimethylallyltransferase MiaA [Syntrophotaleaceae bacterium]
MIVICGPTASGKTGLGLQLADYFDVEIISADSRQVYRGMDIGTAKPEPGELKKVAHHLIDVVDPDEQFTAADFERRGRAAAIGITARNRLPVLLGGTGLYIQTLLHGLVDAPGGDESVRCRWRQIADREGPESLFLRLREIDPPMASRLSPTDLTRIIRALEVHELTGKRLSDLQSDHAGGVSRFRTLKIGLAPERQILYDRIDKRVEEMVDRGLLEETRSLLDQGFHPGLKAMRTIGYREMTEVLLGSLTLDEAVCLIQRNTRRYAKRQITWFGRDEEIIWLDSFAEFAKVLQLIERFIMSR